MPIAKGQPVRQIAPVITGIVASTTWNEDANQFEYLVDYTDADGNPAQRWFAQGQIEQDPPTQGAPA